MSQVPARMTAIGIKAPGGPDGLALDLYVAPARRQSGVALALVEVALAWQDEEACRGGLAP